MNDLTGKIVGQWYIVKFSHTRERKSCGKKRRRRYWQVECTNCKSRRTIESTNLLPPAGGKCQSCWGYDKGFSGLKELYDTYVRNAANYDRPFLLSIEEMKDITSMACHYCGSPPTLIKKTKAKSCWGHYCYNGIDRRDNEIGYTKENCLPCCKICNRAKNNMTYKDFVDYINSIKTREVINVS